MSVSTKPARKIYYCSTTLSLCQFYMWTLNYVGSFMKLVIHPFTQQSIFCSMWLINYIIGNISFEILMRIPESSDGQTKLNAASGLSFYLCWKRSAQWHLVVYCLTCSSPSGLEPNHHNHLTVLLTVLFSFFFVITCFVQRASIENIFTDMKKYCLL